MNDRLYAVGGFDGSSYLKSVEVNMEMFQSLCNSWLSNIEQFLDHAIDLGLRSRREPMATSRFNELSSSWRRCGCYSRAAERGERMIF